MRWRNRLAPLLVTAALPLAACSDEYNPLTDEDDEVIGGAVGPDDRVNDTLKLLQVQLEYPLDGLYEEGEDATLRFAVSNTGTEPATVTDVTGDAFADAIRDGGGDLSIDVPAGSTVFVGSEDEPAVTLVDLDRSLRSSQAIPVTFVFEEAEEATVEAMVASSDENPFPAEGVQDAEDDPAGS